MHQTRALLSNIKVSQLCLPIADLRTRCVCDTGARDETFRHCTWPYYGTGRICSMGLSDSSFLRGIFVLISYICLSVGIASPRLFTRSENCWSLWTIVVWWCCCPACRHRRIRPSSSACCYQLNLRRWDCVWCKQQQQQPDAAAG